MEKSASKSIGAGVNEAVINEIAKIKDPATAQFVSAILGAAAAKAVGGNATAGATAAASGTKWNLELDDHSRNVRQSAYQDFLTTFDKEYLQQKNRGNPYSEAEAAEALNNLYDYVAMSKSIGMTPLAEELLDVFLDQDFSGHGIVNVEYTEHGLPFIEFGSDSLVNENLRHAGFNARLVQNAIRNRIGLTEIPTDVDSYDFYASGLDYALGLGSASAIVSFRVHEDVIEAKITIVDNWDHSQREAVGSFLKDAYIVQQSGKRQTFAYKTTYDLDYLMTDLFHE